MSRPQCAKCPWKRSTDPRDIPHGYCEEAHAMLTSTMAEPGRLPLAGEPLRLMACHESPVGLELPCAGWLAQQLGPGNNLALRLAVQGGRIDGDVRTEGEQHATIEEQLP